MSRKTIWWLVGSLGVAIAAGVVFAVFFYHPKLTVIPKPGEAEVLLAGQPITAGTPIKLTPGTYEVIVRADGYLTTRQTVRLKVGEVNNLAIELRQIPTVRPLVGGAAFPVLTTDQRSIVYLGKSGTQFFRVATELGADGAAQVQPISGERFRDVSNVVWSPDRTLALLQTGNGATQLFDFARYDFVNQEERDLGGNLRAVTWHPTEPIMIAYFSSSDGERSLIRRHLQTGVVDRLADLRGQPFANPTLTWSPDGRQVLVVENAVFLFDVQTRTIRKLAGTDGARAASWNPTSATIVVELNRELVVMNPSGGEATGRLGIRTTLDKTAWSPDGRAILVATSTDQDQDLIQVIDVKTEIKTPMSYQSNQPIDATHLLANTSGKNLWFLSLGTIYSLLLEPAELRVSQ